MRQHHLPLLLPPVTVFTSPTSPTSVSDMVLQFYPSPGAVSDGVFLFENAGDYVDFHIALQNAVQAVQSEGAYTITL